MPQTRYDPAEVKPYHMLSPQEKDEYWAEYGPLMELPGIREHYPESAALYDTWAGATALLGPTPDVPEIVLLPDEDVSVAADMPAPTSIPRQYESSAKLAEKLAKWLETRKVVPGWSPTILTSSDLIRLGFTNLFPWNDEPGDPALRAQLEQILKSGITPEELRRQAAELREAGMMT